MAASTDQLHGRARSIEEQLTKLADSNGSGAELAAVLQEYRAICESVLLSDFEYASTHQIESQLWNATLKVNNAFRKENRMLKKHSKHVVELRKLQKNYLQFIKTSQRFYRGYILSLDARFEGIIELRKIAQKWKDDTARSATQQRIAPAMKKQVLQCCHTNLIQLGDLSRYRETELGDEKSRNWGPAKGYYDLAAEIYPNSGHAHNQLAVIAREDGNHFRAIYHIYRSLASKYPYPIAQQNLELEFKRIVQAWDKGESISHLKSPDGSASAPALIAWFVRLHAKCYTGEEFKEHDDVETEVLSHLANELKERSMDAILSRCILINLSAEYFSSVQMRSTNAPPDIMKTYFYFLRLNVKTFFTLLHVIQPELERLSDANDVTRNGHAAAQLSDKITPVARRVLPGLRLYSTWFTRFWHVLNANIADTLTQVEVQELWKAYAETLSLLASSFPVEQLPTDNYMLDEDAETIGFQPLVSPDTLKIWCTDDNMKLRATDLERNHPNIEMLMRVRDLLVDGLVLTQNADAPLILDGPQFVYREAGIPHLASPSQHIESSPVAEAMELPVFPLERLVAEDQQSYSVVAPSESASTTVAKDNAMMRMVDDLVGAEDGLDPLPEEDENIPPTPPAQTFEDTALVNDSTYGLASFSINDLVNSVQNYKASSGSPAPATPLLSMPMNRVASSSSIRGPANLPSIPDGQWNANAIWNRSYNGTPGPSSPMMPYYSDARGSPYSGSHSSGHLGHARGESANSLQSFDYVCSTARPGGSLGSGAAWGNPPTTQWSSIYGNANGHGARANEPMLPSHLSHSAYTADLHLASPLMWGSSYADKGRSSFGYSPPNGQGG